MDETKFWKKISKKLGEYGHFVRVENSVGPGTPDVSYAASGTQGWIELKVIKNDTLYFEQFQIPWMRARLRHCSTVWVLALDQDQGKIYLWPAKWVVRAPHHFEKKWTLVRVRDLKVFLEGQKFDWQQATRALAAGPIRTG